MELKEQIELIPKFNLRKMAVLEITEGGHGSEWTEVDKPFAVTEEGSVSVISTVSPKYVLVQFSDVFTPIVDSIGEATGNVRYRHGKGRLEIFPENPDYVENGTKIGLRIVNSVDRSQSVRYEFLVLHDGVPFYFNRKLIPMTRQLHVGKIKNLVENLPEMLVNVKKAWIVITEKFNNYKMTEEDIEDGIKELNLGKKISKRLRGEQSMFPATLWFFYTEVMKSYAKRKYKNDFGKAEKLEKLSKSMINWAFLLGV